MHRERKGRLLRIKSRDHECYDADLEERIAPVASSRRIGERDEQNREQIEKEHKAQISLGLAIGAPEFLPS